MLTLLFRTPRDPDDLPHRAPTTKDMKKRGKHRVGGQRGECQPYRPEKVSKLVMPIGVVEVDETEENTTT